jgi:uncharacterized protein
MTDKRTEIQTAMKEAMKSKDEIALGTTRMIIAKMKEQDIEARVKGNMTGIGDSEILSLLQNMVKQRQESAKIYKEGNRLDLADKEEAEIKVLERFLPTQLSDEDAKSVIQALVKETGASSIKDMGKVMAEVKAKYAGQLDMAKAGQMVKDALNAA